MTTYRKPTATMLPNPRKHTIANNAFLARVKAAFNAAIYRKCLALVNGPGGEAEAREYIRRNVSTSF